MLKAFAHEMKSLQLQSYWKFLIRLRIYTSTNSITCKYNKSFCSVPKIQFKLIHPHKPQCEFLETLSNVSCKIQIILFLKITANLGSKKEIGCGGIYWNWYSKMLNYKIWTLREDGYNINKLCWNSPNYMYEINAFNNQTQLDLFVRLKFVIIVL